MSVSMKQQWQQLRDKFSALRPREQLLIAGAGAVIVLVICDQLLWSPLRHANGMRVSRIAELQTQQQNLAAQHDLIRARLAQDPDAELRASIEAVRGRVLAQNTQLQQKTADLIPPEKMASVLREVLQKRNSLTLLELKNEAAVAAFKPEKTSGEDVDTSTETTPLYRHGMTLQLRGRYFEIVAYLQALEQLDWHFYWQELSYKVTNYPEAEVTLKVYTLSDRESWIGA